MWLIILVIIGLNATESQHETIAHNSRLMSINDRPAKAIWSVIQYYSAKSDTL